MIKRSTSILALFALVITLLGAWRQTSAFLPASVSQKATGRLVMHSEPGDYVGGGKDYDFSSPAGGFSANLLYPGIVDTVSVIYWSDDTTPSWFLDFSTRRLGVPLVPGTYRNAERYPHESTGHPALNITGNSNGCNELSGEFTVHEAVYDYSISPPRVVRFVADFIQHCEHISNPPLTGTITFTGEPLKDKALFLPRVSHQPVRPLVAINPEVIETRPVGQIGEIYYTTTVTPSAPLPDGRFFLSAAADGLIPVKVDDELAVLVDGAEVYSIFLTYPRLVELPRELVESWAGHPITVIFRDAHGSVVGSQPVWLVWMP